MKLKERSYPHPVLGNADDVPGSSFQVPFEVDMSSDVYTLKAIFQCNNPTLLELVRSGAAAYVLHVECSNTAFRMRREATQSEIVERIPAEDLNESVDVNFFICACEPIKDYRIEGAHADYEGHEFAIGRGEILAVSEGRTFEATRNYDALKNISSIMHIRRSQQADSVMKPHFAGDKIVIYLSPADYDHYNQLKIYPIYKAALTCAIVLPVLAEGIRLVQTDDEQVKDLKWFRIVKRRMEEVKPDSPNEEPIVLAQELLERPLKRAMEAIIESLEQE